MTTRNLKPARGEDPDRDTGVDVVTGAFSYSGSRIAAALTKEGREVRTLTGHPSPSPTIEAYPLSFTDSTALRNAMAGATTLYNTYWIRFAHGGTDHELAVANSRSLFAAARDSGIQRIVHLSIINPSLDSPLPYFRGKARVELDLAGLGVPYAVVRPGILFGGRDVLINNIAWLLRHLPFFTVGGRGDYRVRGIHVDDLAALCVREGFTRRDTVVDAVGPDRPTFLELVGAVRSAVGSRSVVARVPGIAVPLLAGMLGEFLRDVLLTGDEYRGMTSGLADADGPATGDTSLFAWLNDVGSQLGRRYANELHRHFDPSNEFEAAHGITSR